MKSFLNKQFLTLGIFFILTLLSFFQLYTYFSNKDFQIRSSENTLFLLLSNGSYLDLNPINDVIDDELTSAVKPFPEKINSNFQKLTRFPFQTVKVSQISPNRSASIEKSGSYQIKVLVNSQTKVEATDNHFYYAQLDYSNRFSPTENEDLLEISDNKCNVTIFKTDDYKYKVIDNRSVRIGVKYKPEINIEINMDINCNL